MYYFVNHLNFSCYYLKKPLITIKKFLIFYANYRKKNFKGNLF
jgi:hypothetical protein